MIELQGPAELTVRGDRIELPPPGAHGGSAGEAGAYLVERVDGTVEELPTKAVGVKLAAGDRFVMRTSGGGGLGSPVRARAAATCSPTWSATGHRRGRDARLRRRARRHGHGRRRRRDRTTLSANEQRARRSDDERELVPRRRRRRARSPTSCSPTRAVRCDVDKVLDHARGPAGRRDRRHPARARDAGVEPATCRGSSTARPSPPTSSSSRTGGPVAFVATEGFADLLRLGREARVEEDRYDLLFSHAHAAGRATAHVRGAPSG